MRERKRPGVLYCRKRATAKVVDVDDRASAALRRAPPPVLGANVDDGVAGPELRKVAGEVLVVRQLRSAGVVDFEEAAQSADMARSGDNEVDGAVDCAGRVGRDCL